LQGGGAAVVAVEAIVVTLNGGPVVVEPAPVGAETVVPPVVEIVVTFVAGSHVPVSLFSVNPV
jgi:hypothetical protein